MNEMQKVLTEFGGNIRDQSLADIRDRAAMHRQYSKDVDFLLDLIETQTEEMRELKVKANRVAVDGDLKMKLATAEAQRDALREALDAEGKKDE